LATKATRLIPTRYVVVIPIVILASLSRAQCIIYTYIRYPVALLPRSRLSANAFRTACMDRGA